MTIYSEQDKDGKFYLNVYPSCAVCGKIAEYYSKAGLYYCVLHTSTKEIK